MIQIVDPCPQGTHQKVHRNRHVHPARDHHIVNESADSIAIRSVAIGGLEEGLILTGKPNSDELLGQVDAKKRRGAF